MAKAISICILLSLVYHLSHAQLAIRPQLGVNFPKLTKKIQEGKFDGNIGYQFGVDLQIGTGIIYVQPGLNFETAKLEIADVGDMRIGRINIPVYVGCRLFHAATVGLRLFAGPNFAINVSENLDDSLSYIDEDHIRNAQVSAVGGAGIDLSIFFIDVAYKFSFSGFFDDTIDSDSKLNLFLVNAGLKFRL